VKMDVKDVLIIQWVIVSHGVMEINAKIMDALYAMVCQKTCICLI
jgi:hypothetical protein